ncbi:MAG: alpha/beta hydrolase [Myxococcales bacterium]|nr:alpha/beta hydrolase [Myxococcales bacterium]
MRIEDSGRRKPDGTPRVLVIEVWYPALQASRGGPGETYDVKSLLTDEQRARVADAQVPVLETAAVRDAPPSRVHGPYPLVVFSHGQAAVRWQSTYFTVLLASHGYVVAAPDHEGNTLADALRGTLSTPTASFDARPTDVTVVVNRLARMPEGDPLRQLVDIDRLAVAGHSFGAVTALRVAVTDKRVKAIVPQAPANAELAWLGYTLPVQLGIPVMVQAAHKDRTLPWDEHTSPTWAALAPPRHLLDIVEGGHFTFTDLCAFDLASLAAKLELDLPGVDVAKVLGDGCGPPAPPPGVAQPLINHFAVGFLNAALRGSQGSPSLLSQEVADRFGPGVATVLSEP